MAVVESEKDGWCYCEAMLEVEELEALRVVSHL